MSALDTLSFEEPIAALNARIEELQLAADDCASDINISEEIQQLKEKERKILEKTYNNLTAHQTVQVARHPNRPYTLDYLNDFFTDFDYFAGDRHSADCEAIVGGTARLDGQAVMVIGHQKGRETEEKVRRNFGMPQPEGYRKALRLMQMAERFNLPIITFIDTPGAYPGVQAENHNQSEAIARNLFEMSQFKTPIICTIIGEGGSGGALAIGVGDRLMMLQYSVYATISPEGCASILWKTAAKAPDAAAAMRLTAHDLKQEGLIDHIIPEPLGGAHRNPSEMGKNLKTALKDRLAELQSMPIDTLLNERYERLMLHDQPDK
jgi:acetyl-CoA carboxylase carboxyl transferase subunit alpha